MLPLPIHLLGSEVHMAEDVCRCFSAVTSGDAHGLDEEILLVKGRCMRLMRVLHSNIEENPTRYTGGHETSVLNAVEQLRDKGLCIYFGVRWKLL